MTTDNHEPVINNWFEENVVYEGEGYAEFSNPKGWIRGYAKITFDQSGKANAYLEVSAWECEYGESPDEQRYRLITGRRFLGVIAKPIKIQNICTKFQVKTENGLFETISTVNYGASELNQISLGFSKSQYTINNSSDAHYWVMPLTNFIADSLKGVHSEKHYLDNHPLRIFIPPQLNYEGDAMEMDDSIHNLRLRNYFIQFGFGESLGNLKDNSLDFDSALISVGISPDEFKPYDLRVNENNEFLRWGFIEILPNYNEKKKMLSSGLSQYQITSLMVGCHKNMPQNLGFDETIKQLPTHFSLLLSFASGSYVGVPWVELRTSNGDLVSRLHTSWWQLPYHKGLMTLDSHTGYFYLLTNSPSNIQKNLIEAIRLAIKIRHYNVMSDIMADLFRAFDTLAKNYKLKTKDTPKEILGINYEIIKTIVQKAVKEIERIESQNQDEIEIKIIKRIKGKISSSLGSDKIELDEAIVLLIEGVGLNDNKILESNLENWKSGLKKYRNIVIHDVYFDFSVEIKNQSLSEAGVYLVHLYDLLIRVILKMLNYNTLYRSYLKSAYVLVNWVQADTPSSELGYK